MVEETKNPSRDIPIGLLGSMSIITVVCCLMALSLSMMQKYTNIDRNAAYSFAFSKCGDELGKVPGSPWSSQGDDHCSFGRGAWAGTLHYSYCTSAHDPTVVCSCPPKDMNPYKYYTVDYHFRCLRCFLFKHGCFGNFVICEHVVHLYDDGSCTSCEEILWGIPLVPWLPSLSIATNLFLMGSLGADAFIRFAICTGVMLVYYVLCGLHATYDMAHEQHKPESLKVTEAEHGKCTALKLLESSSPVDKDPS